MKTSDMVIVAIAFGFVATLYTSSLNVTPNGLVGATWYGWPMAWMYHLVTFPPAVNVNSVNLLVDVIVWFIVAMIVQFAAGYLMKGGKKR